MNFKSRVSRIEKYLYLQLEGIDESVLLNPKYKYKRDPFNSTGEMLEALNVVERSPYYDVHQIIQFCMNGLLSFESEEMEDVRRKAGEEMRRML